MRKRVISILIILSLCLALLGGCVNDNERPAGDEQPDITEATKPGDAPDSGKGDSQKDSNRDSGSSDADFDSFLDELFEDWVTSDTITLQFFLTDPEAMGIERPVPTYGEVMTPELFLKEKEETESIIKRLERFSYSALSKEQQLTYDIISRNLELSKILEEKEDYSYYSGYIRPLTGMQIQLPVLLAEFKFNTAGDIEAYLELLSDTIRYFDDVIAFERERAARGYFMSRANLDSVIEGIEAFLEDRENNLLISVVEDKIDSYPGLTDAQRDDFKQRNRGLVLDNVLVAYDNLLDAMLSLKDSCGTYGGLANLPDGARVAHARLKLGTGSDMSITEFVSAISIRKDQALARVRAILTRNSRTMDLYLNDGLGEIPAGTPEAYLTMLQDAMSEDFPSISTIDYKVLEVHESLRDSISPAFYLEPSVDDFTSNVIYVNPSSIGGSGASDNLSLFTMLAHEGYPGHMYETVYFRQKSSPHPIRIVLSNTGHSEGWATYVEYISYGYAGLDPLEAEFMAEMDLYYLLLQANADLGVNLLGWTIEQVGTLLYNDLGIEDEEIIEDYFNSLTAVPLNISQYAVGVVEFFALRDYVEGIQGDAFSAYKFHEAVLTFGPAPFSLIKKYLW